MWVLDPIDGTKGFLRGEQYAVCLALVVDGVVQLGVLGCPNLPVSPTDPSHGQGVIVLALRGQGAYQAAIPSLSSPSPPSASAAPAAAAESFDSLLTPIKIPTAVPSSEKLRTLESVEAAHSAQGFTAAISRALGLSAPPNRMDSQAKYAALARGFDEGHLYLRMPVPGKNYIEKIWVRLNVPFGVPVHDLHDLSRASRFHYAGRWNSLPFILILILIVTSMRLNRLSTLSEFHLPLLGPRGG